MKNLILILFCFIVLFGCKQKPTYNPFDNQFNIDESYFIKDKLDTIWDTCGYYYLSKKDTDFEISYGYLGKDLIGKSFSMEIDTVKLKSKYYFEVRDSINSLTFNPKRLNTALKKFNYAFYKQIKSKVLLINKKENKIDTAQIYSNDTDYISFYRTVMFINDKKIKSDIKKLQN